MTRTPKIFAAVALALVLIHVAPAAYAADPLAPAASPVLADGSSLLPAGSPMNPAASSFLASSSLAPSSLNVVEAGQRLLPAHRNVDEIAAETGTAAWERKWRKRWLVSVAPLVAAQALDAASSYGLRELNPALAGPDGRFGMQATALKFGVIGGLVGAEALLVKKFPRSAKFFTVVNYSAAGIATGLAVHNYRLPGR